MTRTQLIVTLIGCALTVARPAAADIPFHGRIYRYGHLELERAKAQDKGLVAADLCDQLPLPAADPRVEFCPVPAGGLGSAPPYQINVTLLDYDANQGFGVVVGVATVSAAADGTFAGLLPVSPIPSDHNSFRLVVSSPNGGGESTVFTHHMTHPFIELPALDLQITGAAEAVSLDGSWWARRVGEGQYPIFLIDGWDPLDGVKTDAMSGMIAGTFLGERYLGDFLASPKRGSGDSVGYSLWIVTGGTNTAESIMGTAAQQHTDGSAYVAMELSKRVYDDVHAALPAGPGMVVVGFSAGGLIALTGLARWCNGFWAGQRLGMPGHLGAGCPQVALLVSGDAPLEGARIPSSLQIVLQDNDMANLSPLARVIDGPAVRELLVDWVQGPCNTPCFRTDGIVGATALKTCDSRWGDTAAFFREECTVLENNNRRDAMVAWQAAAGFPQQAGLPLPAIAFSLGTAPTLPGPAYCNGGEYLRARTDGWRADLVPVDATVQLFYNTANGPAGGQDCFNGSQLTPMRPLDGIRRHFAPTFLGIPLASIDLSVDVLGPVGPAYYRGPKLVSAKMLPPFIPTASALTSTLGYPWLAAKSSAFNGHHVAGTLPPEIGRFAAGWIYEYTQGTRARPICHHPDRSNPGDRNGIECRNVTLLPCINQNLFTGEQTANGKDDDGDGEVDEPACCVPRVPFGPCQPPDCGDGYCEPGEDESSCYADCCDSNGDDRADNGCEVPYPRPTGSGNQAAEEAEFTTLDALVVAGTFDTQIQLGGPPLYPAGSQDVFLIASDRHGAFRWQWRLGGWGVDTVSGLSSDPQTRAVVIGGAFNDEAWFGPVDSEALTTLCPGGGCGRNLYAAKFDASGAPLWAIMLDVSGDSGDQLTDIRVASDGAITIAGYFTGTVDLVDMGGPLLTAPGEFGHFLIQLDAGGGYRWARAIETSSYPQWGSSKLAIDRWDRLYLSTFEFASPSRILRFTAGGSRDGAWQVDIDMHARLLDLVAGPDDDVYLVGAVNTDGIDVGCGLLPSYPGRSDMDVLVAKFDEGSGGCVWSKRFGYENFDDDYGTGVDVDGEGRVVVTGNFRKQVSFGGAAPLSISQSGPNAFVLTLDGATGATRSWYGFGGTAAYYVPNNGNGYWKWPSASALEVAMDSNGQPAVVGKFKGTIDMDGETLTSDRPDAQLDHSDGLFIRQYGALVARQTVDASGHRLLAYTSEVCNRADDDHDGVIDDGFLWQGLTVGSGCSAGVGACQASGEVACDEPGHAGCTAIALPAGDETCGDGIDEDCDGAVDECPCAVPERAGDQVDNDCDVLIDEDTEEVCDGYDNDGDGVPDDGMAAIFATDCPDGIDEDCDGVVDENGPADVEACDWIDNDCDGAVDECPCAVTERAGDAVDDDCDLDASDVASAEVCDGYDNTGDIVIDEGFGVGGACTNACGSGILACRSGNPLATVCESAVAEVCNGFDDDCDGQGDEGFPGLGAPCDGGDTGFCREGVWSCTPEGTGVQCSDTSADDPELCNALDDDCDGSTDEGYGVGGACTAGYGTCACTGIRICSGGVAVCNCTQGTPAAQDTCGNAIDDDCDGAADEGCAPAGAGKKPRPQVQP